jgi:hypothetical protein
MRPFFMFRDMSIWHNVTIWTKERSRDFVEHEPDSSEVNVWCALTRDHVIDPYFFAEGTVTSHIYLDMLELFAVPQINDDNMIFQQEYSYTLCQHCYWIACSDISTALDWKGRMEVMAPTLSRPDAPGFLFLGVCEANRLQCSYSQHSTLETANQGNRRICHSWCSWSSVAGNGIPLRCLQSH